MRIFLSAATAEFGDFRPELEQHLTSRGRTVVIQEGFVAWSQPTLDMLDRYIADCDVVVHLIGDLPGAMAPWASVAALLKARPDIGDRFPVLKPFLDPAGPALSYTQWEAWLALYHRKGIYLAAPLEGAPRSSNYVAPTASDQASQAAHRTMLAQQECHENIEFKSIELLAIALHKALAAVRAGPAGPCDIPPAAGHFVGRVKALEDLVRRLRLGEHATVVGTAGFGKTALAAAALRRIVGEQGEHLGSSPWPDGIVMLDLYVHRGQAEPAWHELANRLQGIEFLPDRSARDRATEALRNGRVLLVVEGAEQADGHKGRTALADLQRPLGSRCRWLVLTRTLEQADPVSRIWLQDLLDASEAGELLDELTAGPLRADIREPVLQLLQGHPLALTWAGKLMARGDEDPAWLLKEWQAGHLRSLADPTEGRHTLAWLFDRSVSRLDDAARDALSVAGCLALTPVPLAAFTAASDRSDDVARGGLRSLVQHGLMRMISNHGQNASWQFAHVLAHVHAREQCPASDPIRIKVASWLMVELDSGLGNSGLQPDAAWVSASFEHAAALLKGDKSQALWSSVLLKLLYPVYQRLTGLGWSAHVEACLSAVALGLDAASADAARDTSVVRERSVVSSYKADLYRLRGNFEAAEGAYREALAANESLVKLFPYETRRQVDLALTLNKLCKVLRERDDLVAAEGVIRESHAIAIRLSEAEPDDLSFQRLLQIGHDELAMVRRAQRDFSGAEQAYRAALAICEHLAQVDPTNMMWQRDLGLSMGYVGVVLNDQGNLTEAARFFNASLAVREPLAESDPSNAEWQRDLSFIYTAIAAVFERTGETVQALEMARRSLVIDERLVAIDPSNATWRSDVIVSREMVRRLEG